MARSGCDCFNVSWQTLGLETSSANLTLHIFRASIGLLAFLVAGLAYKRLVLGQRGLDQLPVVPFAERVVEAVSFVKDMVLIVVLTTWDKLSGMVHRLTGRRGGGFRGEMADFHVSRRIC